MIDRLRSKYSISALCRYLGCSRSGYYDWNGRGKPNHNKLDAFKESAILSVYYEKTTRGRRQVQMHLERKCMLHMSLGSVHRYMVILGLNSTRRKRYVSPKKEAQNPLHTFPNVLQQDFRASARHKKWLTDITYLPCKDGKLYLSCIKDLGDKSIVAYSISAKNDIYLVLDMLVKAKPFMREGIVLHSDRGSQYCSPIYQSVLLEKGIVISMSRPGMPYDNAPMESFFSILKNEELRLFKHLTCSQMRNFIDCFIRYYNEDRPQWSLKKLTPFEFRSQLV